MTQDRAEVFRELHRSGTFLLPNPWDIGSARVLASLGFAALATTSSGHAASLGRRDQRVTRDELLTHAEALAAAVDVPLHVDAERCFADDPAGVAETVRLVAATGAVGCSIEDFDPATDTIDEVTIATERVAAACDAAHATGLLVTARAEQHLYGPADLDDTIARLVAYARAGADVVYAPGLVDLGDIARVVAEVPVPVNVLALPGGPTVPELTAVGVRRVSTGGALAWAAYGALASVARELLEHGTSPSSDGALTAADRDAAFR